MRPDRRANVISHLATKPHLSFSKHTRVSSACLAKPAEKTCPINFLRCLTVGVLNYWQQAVFLFHNRTFLGRSNTAPRGKRRPSVVAKHRICNRYRTTPSNWPQCPELPKIPGPSRTLSFLLRRDTMHLLGPIKRFTQMMSPHFTGEKAPFHSRFT